MAGRGEQGFTLIELLMATVILGVVMSALAAAVIVGLRTTGDTETRLAESHDAQMASAWFVTDANSARTVTYSSAITDTCDGTPVTAPSQVPVRFSWVEGTVNRVADYVVETAGGERRLSRLYCESGTFPRRVTVAHRLHPSGTPWSLTCVPDPCSSPTPTSVRLTLTDASGYTFALAAARRTTP